MPVIHRLLCQVLRLLACKLRASALLFLEKRLLSSQKINLQPEILCSRVVSSLYKGSSDDSTFLIIFSYAHWTSCTVLCNPILSDRITIKKVQFVWKWMFEFRSQFVKYWHFPVSPTRQILTLWEGSQTDLQSESLWKSWERGSKINRPQPSLNYTQAKQSENIQIEIKRNEQTSLRDSWFVDRFEASNLA